MAAKAQHVIKSIGRQFGHLAEAVGSAASSHAPDSSWQQQEGPLPPPSFPSLNPSAAAFTPAYGAATRSAGPAASSSAAHSSPAHAPVLHGPLRHSSLQRYLEQLGLAAGSHPHYQPPPQHLPHQLAKHQAGAPMVLAGPLGLDLGPNLFGVVGPQQQHTPLPGLQELLAVSRGIAASYELPGGKMPVPPMHPSMHQQRHPLPLHQHQQQQHPQQQQHTGRRPRAAAASVSLNKEIMAATTTSALLAIVKERGAQMDFFNLSSATARMPKLAGLQGGTDAHAGPHHQQASLDPECRELTQSLAQLVSQKIHLFDARGLANSSWAFAKMRFTPSPELPSLIAEQAVARMDEFGAQNISNLVWSFVYMHFRDERVLSLLARRVCRLLDDFKPQELANVLWAFASLEFHDAEMVHVAFSRAARIAPMFKEQELSNAIWAMARLKHYSPQTFSALLNEARSKLPLFLPQGISNIAWAMATLEHRDAMLLRLMAAQCRDHLPSFDSQALSNLTWSFAHLGFYDAPLMEGLAREATLRIERLGPQNLATILSACATLGQPLALSAWSKQVIAKAASFDPQALASLAQSFAKLGSTDPDLFEALAAAAVARQDPGSWTSGGLAQTAWAFATAGHYSAALMNDISCRLLCTLDANSPQDCSVALWAFAQLRHQDTELFDGILARLASEAGSLDASQLANALWACAQMGHAPGAFGGLLARQAVALLPQMAARELCQTMWALSCMDVLDVEAFEEACDHLVRAQAQGQPLNEQDLHQALEAQLLMRARLQREPRAGPAPQLPTSVLQPALQLRLGATAAACALPASPLVQEVSAALRAAGVPNSAQQPSPDGLLVADLEVHDVAGRRVVIEVLEPPRTSASLPHVPLGSVEARRRLLEARGMTVVSLGLDEWRELDGTSLAQRGTLLLARILQKVEGPSSDVVDQQDASYLDAILALPGWSSSAPTFLAVASTSSEAHVGSDSIDSSWMGEENAPEHPASHLLPRELFD